MRRSCTKSDSSSSWWHMGERVEFFAFWNAVLPSSSLFVPVLGRLFSELVPSPPYFHHLDFCHIFLLHIAGSSKFSGIFFSSSPLLPSAPSLLPPSPTL